MRMIGLVNDIKHEYTTHKYHAPYHQSDPHWRCDRSGPGRLAVPGENGRPRNQLD